MANGFFSGRNGSDALSVFLVAAAVVVAVAASVLDQGSVAQIVLIAIAIALALLSFFRMLSTNTARRRYENDKFTSIFRKDPEKARKKADRKTHRYFKCPECKKELRVPKGKGKIRITCPHCGHQFIKRT